MTALERAARAIAEVDEKTHRRLNMYGVHKDRYDEYVRAVLMAVREPGREACFVGDQLVGDHGSNGQGVFTAMIDAILNEKDTTNE